MKQSKYGMPTPNTRKEYERNIGLVIEDTSRKLNSGNDDLIQNVLWATYPSLKKVTFLPNRRINLTTVNERIRLQSNMKNWIPSFRNSISEERAK